MADDSGAVDQPIKVDLVEIAHDTGHEKSLRQERQEQLGVGHAQNVENGRTLTSQEDRQWRTSLFKGKVMEKLLSQQSFKAEEAETFLRNFEKITTNHSYAACQTILGLIGAAVFCSGLMALPLLSPLKDASEGVWANWSFFFIYNTFVSFFYLNATWSRFTNTIVRGASADSPALQIEPWYKSARGVAIGMTTTLAATFGIVLLALPWGDRLEHSYLLFYGVCLFEIVVLGSFWYFFVPPKEKTAPIATLLFLYNCLCIMPLLMILGLVVLDTLVVHPAMQISTPIIGAVFANILYYYGEKVVMVQLGRARLQGTYHDTGMGLELSSMFVMSEVLLFPSASTIWTLVGVLLADLLCQAIYFYQFRQVYSDLIASGAGGERKQQEEHTEVAEAEAEANRVPPSLCNAAIDVYFERSEELKGASAAAREELKNFMWIKAEEELAMLICPIVFVVAYALINEQREHFYLYECVDDDTMRKSFIYIGIKLLFQFLLVSVEFIVLARCHLASIVLTMYCLLIRSKPVGFCFTILFVAASFTACWLIKHDGLQVLHRLCSG
mmetsp:Transcript_24993/g.59368  ORF Transcript_24993/g.59368 Transcript_24993/m.59368 type:complete len:556 (+) Transcript_24993:165-1832(+)